jgi:aryl-alcohol dehydrogenase-like predicted oxidoreductase
VDYYWVHKDDPGYPIEELVDTLNLIVKQGKARLVGASNFTTERFRSAAAYAGQTGQITLSASQIQWSLAATEDRYLEKFGSLTMTQERYDYYLENQIPVFAFSAQAQGFFQRVASGGIGCVPPFIAEQYDSPTNTKRLEKLQQYAQEHHCSLSAPALGYLIHNRLPCVAIIGASSVEMLGQSLEAVSLPMTAEEADALAQV